MSIYFDGRKDRTIIQVKKGNKASKDEVTEEHVVILVEPGARYVEFVDHVTPSSGYSSQIASEILTSLRSKGIATDNIQAIGCDGTVVDRCSKHGVTALHEQTLGRSLQWLICQLHCNELPLRHLVMELDRKTTGPLGFTGPMGRLSNVLLLYANL